MATQVGNPFPNSGLGPGMEATQAAALSTGSAMIRLPEENLFATREDEFGYFPYAASDRTLREYRIVRKLGWAKSSSVWLAIDTSKPTLTFVSLKILTSHATEQIVNDISYELDALKAVEGTNPNHTGFRHCLALQRWFFADSPHGRHICFVTDPLSSSLQSLNYGGHKVPVAAAKVIIKQLLQALDYFHRECGFIHSDIKSDNILLRIPTPIDSRIDEYIKNDGPAQWGPPMTVESFRLPVAVCVTQPLPYFEMGGTFDSISVCLMDFGEAISVHEINRTEVGAKVVRAPEVILNYYWSSAVDIWAVGCLLFEIVSAHFLFGQDSPEYSPHIHLQNIMECLGPLPASFLAACDPSERTKYLNEDGTLIPTKDGFCPLELETILRGLEAVDEEDIPGLAAFLRRCLTLDPAFRPSAQDLLKDDWLNKVDI